MKIDQGSHEVSLWQLIMEPMKMSYNDEPRNSWSCVLRIDHRSNEVELQRLIIDVMKMSYHDWL